MRKFPLGQDRYARQYWILSSMGGVMVEGVETSLDKNLQVNLDFVDMSTVGPKGIVQSAGSVEEIQSRVPIDNKTSKSSMITKEDQSDQFTKEDEKAVSISLVYSQQNTSTDSNELQEIYEGDHSTMLKSRVTSDDVRDAHGSDEEPELAQGYYHSKTTTPKVFSDSTNMTFISTSQLNSSRETQASNLQKTTEQEADRKHHIVPQSSKQLERTSWERNSANSEIDEQRIGIFADTHSISGLPNSHLSPRQTRLGMQHSGILPERDLSSPPPLTSIIQESPEPNTEPLSNTQLHASLSCSESLGEEDGVKDFGKDSQQNQETLATGQPPIERMGTVHSQWETSTHQMSRESTKPWFSIGPRHPCETSPQLGNPQQAQIVLPSNVLQQQQVISGGPSQQQYVMAAPTTQYAYMTPDGQVIAAPGGQSMVPQLGVEYRLIGNTLVQVPQTQYVAVDSTGGIIGNFVSQQAPSVQYAVTQTNGGAQYVVMAGDSENAGYISTGGTDGKPALVQTVNQDGEQVLAQVIQDERGQMLLPLNQGDKQQRVMPVANGQNLQQAQVDMATQGVVYSDNTVVVPEAGVNTKGRSKAGSSTKRVVKVESETPTSIPMESFPHPTIVEVNSDKSDRKDMSYGSTYRSASSDVSIVGGHNDQPTNSFAVKDGMYIQQGNSSHQTAVSGDTVNLGITSSPQETLSTDDTQVSGWQISCP